MSVLAATDLDHTLIFSRRSAGAGKGAKSEAADETDVVCVEVYDGAPLSFMTSQAHRALAGAMATGRVVPVTTRTVAQFQRIRLPGPPPPLAVCLNGGRLLVNGVVDDTYSAAVASAVACAASPFAVVLTEVIRASTTASGVLAPWVKRVRNASEAFFYVVYQGCERDDGWLDAVRAIAAEHGWQVSVQGQKVYVVPTPLTKDAALAHVVERTGAVTILAAGDSLLDEHMILSCDHGMVPSMSELHMARATLPGHVAVTRGVGLAAGEEIATWVARELCLRLGTRERCTCFPLCTKPNGGS